jgi:hypothetical protein
MEETVWHVKYMKDSRQNGKKKTYRKWLWSTLSSTGSGRSRRDGGKISEHGGQIVWQMIEGLPIKRNGSMRWSRSGRDAVGKSSRSERGPM